MATYYLATTGNDGNNGSIGSPWLTFTFAMRQLTASDILLIRGGTYTETDVYGNVAADTFGPGATSWATATQVKNYPGEAVSIVTRGINMDNSLATGGVGYLIFEGDTTSNFKFTRTGGSDQSGFRFHNASHHVRIKRCEIYGWDGIGIQAGTSATPPEFVEIVQNYIHDNGDNSGGEYHEHGIYPGSSRDWLVDGNIIEDNYALGIQFWASTPDKHQRATIRNNRVYGNKVTTANVIAGIYVMGDDHVIDHNVVIGPGLNRDYNIGIQTGTGSNIQIYNNTIYDCSGAAVQLGSGSTSPVVKGNVFFGNGTDGVQDLGATTPTISDNHAANPSFVSLSGVNSNLSLNTGSAALDASVDVGLTYQGTAPEYGAYEVMKFTSGEVVTGDESTIRLTFGSNWHPPLPATGITGFTARRNTGGGPVANVITAAVTNGNKVYLTVTDAYAFGDTIDISYDPATGNLTDSTKIGNTDRQKFIYTLTNQSITNNIENPNVGPAAPTGLTLTRV